MPQAGVCLLLSLLIASCSSPSDSPVTPVKPTPGSKYTYSMYLDSAGVVVPGSEETVTSIVLETNASIAGKSRVLVVEEGQYNGSEKNYYTYEADDTFSMLLNAEDLSKARWLNLPVTGGLHQTVTIVDTFFLMGLPIIMRVATSAYYSGKKVLSISQGSLLASVIDLDIHEVWTRNGVTLLDGIYQRELHYCESIGFVTRTVTLPYKDAYGLDVHGNVRMLTRYEIR